MASFMVGEGEGGSCDNHQPLNLLIMSEDVLIQILLWLPVISLLRFKSVSKSWRSIIESTFFIHLHATKLAGCSSSSSSSSSSVLLFDLGEKEKKGNSILTLSGEEFEFFDDNLGIPATLLDHVIGEEKEFGWFKGFGRFGRFLAVGCCDGIICLHEYFTRNFALWNPATKQSRILPKPSNLLGCSKCYSIFFVGNDDDLYISEDFGRFGIDIKTNDYKLLLITTFKLRSTNHGSEPDEQDERYMRSLESPHRRRVHVYSLSTDSWKSIDDATLSAATHPDLAIDIRTDYNKGLYLNGSYYFTAICYKEDMYFLLSFDFTEEIFKTIQPPFDLNNKKYSTSYVVYFIRLGGKVALVDFQEDLFCDIEYNIWVLNENEQQHSGMKESWTKLYTIGPSGRLSNQPIFITNNGEFAITFARYWQDDDYTRRYVLELLNLITGEKKLLPCVCKYMDTDCVYVYNPSLMPIGGNGATPT